MRGSAFLEPEWVARHPSDYQDIRLLTDTAGQFFGGGPFQGPYGNSGMADASNQITGATDVLGGKAVYVTPAIGGAGTAVIGTRDGRRCGVVGVCWSRARTATAQTSSTIWFASGRREGSRSLCTAAMRTSKCGWRSPQA